MVEIVETVENKVQHCKTVAIKAKNKIWVIDFLEVTENGIKKIKII